MAAHVDGTPRVAVVVPTRARETRLAFALEALAAQTIGTGAFEVLLVRDGDVHGPRTPPPHRLRTRTLTMPARGTPAEKRNAGWRATAAPLVAFTDDDCRPHPGWLEALVAAWESADGEPLVIQGAVKPDPDETHLLTGLARSLTVTAADGWFQTANLALTRPLLERLEGFDERFSRTGEDTDLGLRAVATGAEVRFAEGALVWHAVHTLALPAAIRDRARADQVAELIRRHPAQRDRLYRRVFWKRSHALVALALAGMLARRPALAALAALPYALANYDRSVPPSARHAAAVALHLPARFAVDLAETVQTARGAVRSRTPLI
ncbi:MAG TPA: glycosyltransferase [Solirubrobacterales bacterium]|nr:glycosyltransferase [Solirubrobacterales bacterium]